MARPAFTLAALATGALPGLEIATARGRTTGQSGDFDAAEIIAADGQHMIIRIPRTQAAERDQSADLVGLRALTDGLRQRLPFQVPSYLGQAPIGPTRGVLYTFIQGAQLTGEALTSDAQLAASVGRAIAAIHTLPTSLASDAGLPNNSAAQERLRVSELVTAAAATGHVPAALVSRWQDALDEDKLWQFVPTVINGELAPDSFLVVGDSVNGLLGWASLAVGDPAHDIHWLLSARGAFAELALSSYIAARGGMTENVLARRALLYGELELARWLLHGTATRDDAIVTDAIALLDGLVSSVFAESVPSISNETGPILTMTEVESMLSQTPVIAAAESVSSVSLMTDGYDRSEFEAAVIPPPTEAPNEWRPAATSFATDAASASTTSAEAAEPVAADPSVFEGVRDWEPAHPDDITTEPLGLPRTDASAEASADDAPPHA
ncbi:MAG: phosphotransferase [Microbacteriaceae bacterium]